VGGATAGDVEEEEEEHGEGDVGVLGDGGGVVSEEGF
jgi:hypothetical protein